MALNNRGAPISDAFSADQARLDLASLYDINGGNLAKRVDDQSPPNRAPYHREVAANLKAGILDLFWDSQRLAFYDFNLTANARNVQFSAAHWYPLWANIIPDEIRSSKDKAFGAFASLNFALRRYNGTYPATFIETGLQWGNVGLFFANRHSLNSVGRFPELMATSYILYT